MSAAGYLCQFIFPLKNRCLPGSRILRSFMGPGLAQTDVFKGLLILLGYSQVVEPDLFSTVSTKVLSNEMKEGEL